MVAETANLPNLRRLFIPDPDHVMIEADLEKADVHVVAWEADAKRLKQIFHEGRNLHLENAVEMFNCKRSEAKIGGQWSPYQRAKVGCHAVDYKCTAKTLSAHINTTVHEADRFIKRWLEMNPEIKKWQDDVEARLRVEGGVNNKFGFRIKYFDKLDRKRLGEALAWLGSSPVSIVINKGLLNVDANIPEAELLLQIHDSLLMQTHKSNIPEIYPRLQENMRIVIPYADPLTIPVEIKASEKSWGDVKPI